MKSPIYAVSFIANALCLLNYNIDACELPASTGSCSGNETRWYYSSKSSTCQQFTYSGCGGNKNNFKTIQDCVNTCGEKLENVNNHCIYDVRL